MKKKKVAVAMSGGVDSGVAAALLVKESFDCTGFHMHLWKEPGGAENKCCSTESLEAARKTAHQLEMSFHTVDLGKVFKKKVVDYFLKAYGTGLTPNPCVMCNRFIKFGELFDYVQKMGFDYLATGHYARIKDGYLLQAKDKNKDQTYFLYNLTKKKLNHVLFPVGDYLKKQVWKMAKKWQLPVAERSESQEICFFPGSDYRSFLKRRLLKKIKPGEVVNVQDRVIGKHKGIPLYTIGQRHGFEITDPRVLGPLYVIAKDAKKNQLMVGFGKEAEKKEFQVKDVNWLSGKSVKDGTKCQVRIRHQGKLLPTKLSVAKQINVILDEPERGIASGQAAVFYDKQRVLGGGIIVDKN